MSKFYFHPIGSDMNGNFFPEKADTGWLELEAASIEDAVAMLPPAERAKVQKFENECVKQGNNGKSLGEKIALEAGWGMGFTLLNEVEWDCWQ